MPWQRDSPSLEVGRSCLSAEPEAWGAVWAVWLADHMIVGTNCFWWLLCAQTSWPNDRRNRNDMSFCLWEVWYWFYSNVKSLSAFSKGIILPVLAWIVLRCIIWRSTTQNPSSCFGILCLTLRQGLHLLRGTGRGCSFSCGAIVWRTFQDSNLWWGSRWQRVILDHNSSSNRWATHVGFPGPERNRITFKYENTTV